MSAEHGWGPTGGWSKEQCGEERESGENPRALWVASNRLKKPEVHEMDPGMTMAGPKEWCPHNQNHNHVRQDREKRMSHSNI